MVKNGQLKRSTLERAINKAGALSGEMTFPQFSSVINNLIQKDVDQAGTHIRAGERACHHQQGHGDVGGRGR